MPGPFPEPDLATRCTRELASRLALDGVPINHAVAIADTARPYWPEQIQARDGTDLWLAAAPLDDDNPAGKWEVHVGTTTGGDPVVEPGVKLISLREVCTKVLLDQVGSETGAGHA